MLKIDVLFLITLVLTPNLTTSQSFFDFLFPKCFCNCGISRQNRILGGQPIQNEFPWTAYLYFKNKAIPAALINDKYVITSASQLLGATPHDVKASLGISDRCSPEVSTTNFSVNSITIHADYSTTNKIHDIALTRLNTGVNLAAKYPSVCLGSKVHTEEIFETTATVLGWNDNVKNTDQLTYCKPLKLRLPILRFFECFSAIANKQFLTSDKNCIGVIGASSGICKSDAGGPVMIKNRQGSYELIGILSDENVCGNPPSVSLYTKIAPHLSWIKENTKDACYCGN